MGAFNNYLLGQNFQPFCPPTYLNVDILHPECDKKKYESLGLFPTTHLFLPT